MFTILPSFCDDSFLMLSISYKSSDPNKSLHVSSKPGMFVCFLWRVFKLIYLLSWRASTLFMRTIYLFIYTMNKWAAWPHILLITLERRESAATFILFLSIEKGDDMLTAIFLGSKNFKDDEMFYIKTRPFSSHNSKLVLSHKNIQPSIITFHLAYRGLWRKMHTKEGAPPPLMRHVWALKHI